MFLRISVGGAITCMVSVDGAITCMVGVNQLNGCKHVQRLTINGINMYKDERMITASADKHKLCNNVCRDVIHDAVINTVKVSL